MSFYESVENLMVDKVNGNFICKKEMTDEMRAAIKDGNCRRLVLGYGVWDDLKFLAKLERPVESLLLKSDKLDWESISNMPDLKALHIDFPVREFVDFSGLKSLKGLKCYWDKKNFDSILSLKSLKKLVLWNAKLEDFSNFSEWPSLESLEIIGGSFKSLDGLGAMPKLKAFSIARATKLEDVEELNRMQGLLSLDFESCNKVSFPSSLYGLKSLKRFSLLKQKNFKSLDVIRECKGLEIIQVFEMSVESGDLDFIDSLPCLKRVIIEPKKHYNVDTRYIKEKYVDQFGGYDKNVNEIIGIEDYFS